MKKRRRRGGFTLVEIIVALVILAILAAILIPAMVRWIDRAREKSAVVEARACLTAMQTIAVERFGIKKQYDLAADKEETLLLAGAPEGADILEGVVNAETATVEKMVYQTADGIIVTFENGAFTIGGQVYSLGNKADLDTIYGVIGETLGNRNIQVNSGAGQHPDSAAAAIVAELDSRGISLPAMGAKTWLYYENGARGKFLCWSQKDVSTLNVGDPIVYMRYNSLGAEGAGTFTVWRATVVEKTDEYGTYKAINKDGSHQRVGPATGLSETYENMLQSYEETLENHPEWN